MTCLGGRVPESTVVAWHKVKVLCLPSAQLRESATCG